MKKPSSDDSAKIDRLDAKIDRLSDTVLLLSADIRSVRITVQDLAATTNETRQETRQALRTLQENLQEELQDVKETLQATNEAIDIMIPFVKRIPAIEQKVDGLQTDMRIVRIAVTDTNNNLHHLDHRVTRLKKKGIIPS